MTIKNSVLLLLLSFFGFLSYGQNYSTGTDIDEFYVSIPLKGDPLGPIDTSNIDPAYSHVVLDKTINYYSYFKKSPKISVLVIRTTYLRNLKGVAYLIDKDIASNKKYGITIFKSDGETIHFTDELKSTEFNEKLKKEVRPGDIVRYYYSYNTYGYDKGAVYLSETAPVLKCKFIFQTEDKMEYAAIGENGLNQSMDSTIEGFQILEFTGSNLPIIKDEKFTASNISMARVIYYVTYIRHYTEDKFDLNYICRYYQKMYKREYPAIESITSKVYPKIGIKEKDSDDEKVQKIDDYMNDNYQIINFNFSKYSIDLKKLFGDDYLSGEDAKKYYISLLKRADIELEIAYASNRLNYKVSPELETEEFFQYFLLFIPETGKYLMPHNEYYKYGQLPLMIKDNKVLYILDHKFGDIESSKYVFRDVEANGHNENIESLNLSIDLNNANSTSTFSKSYQGDYAISFSNSFEDLYFDDKENIFNNSCKLLDPKGVPTTEYSFDNSKGDSFAITGDFYANGLILNNGTELEIGKLLGQKEELSSPAKRQAQFAILPQTRNVTINITLPNGKKATNLDDFKATYSDEESDNSPIAYKLRATQEGNVVSITLKEVFKKTVYDKAEYPEVKEMFDLANKIYSKKLIIQ